MLLKSDISMELQHPRVMLVDDDEVYLFAATKTIEATGLAAKIDVCNNGLDAINFLNNQLQNPSNLPEIIFIDLNMPIMDGWEFLEAYELLQQKLPGKIKIYILSSSVDKNDIMRSKKYGSVIEYIVKPVFKAKFSEILQNDKN